jgi:hypothetical protein
MTSWTGEYVHALRVGAKWKCGVIMGHELGVCIVVHNSVYFKIQGGASIPPSQLVSALSTLLVAYLYLAGEIWLHSWLGQCTHGRLLRCGIVMHAAALRKSADGDDDGVAPTGQVHLRQVLPPA